MKASEYLKAVKERHNMASDYAVSLALGVSRQSVSTMMKGGGMDPTTAARIAELLNLPPLQVIADAEIERAKRPEVKKFWMRYAAEVFAGAGAAAAAAAAAALAALPSPAEAAVRTLCILCQIGRAGKSGICASCALSRTLFPGSHSNRVA